MFVKKTCSAFDTYELSGEVNAWTRWKAATSAKGRGSGKITETSTSKSKKEKGKQQNSASRPKLFNLCTYKLSVLGEYVWAILQYGMTEGYLTQTVCSHSSLFIIDGIERANLNTGVLSGFMPNK